MFDRFEQLIGKDKLKEIQNKKVFLIGLGGVGGSCFNSLVRSGIETIYVCDFDKFEISNLNRQLLSNLNNLNKYKTSIAKQYSNLINERCNIIEIKKKLSKDNLSNYIPLDIDYIIDACDDVNTKVSLIKFAINNNIKIISSMGAGNKLNPEKLCITNIWKTNYDPLAKKIRYLLKKEKINYKLPVVSSTEESIKNNIVTSFAPVVNTAGILLASYVINDIIRSYKYEK